MIRVVFDTSVLYSAILKPKGVPAAVFDFVGSGLLIPCVSTEVLAEYRDVLLDRPALRPYAQQAQHVLDILTSVAVEVTPIQRLKISGHESDNRFYECADAARADYIVTGNLKHFSQSHKNTRIVNPRPVPGTAGRDSPGTPSGYGSIQRSSSRAAAAGGGDFRRLPGEARRARSRELHDTTRRDSGTDRAERERPEHHHAGRAAAPRAARRQRPRRHSFLWTRPDDLQRERASPDRRQGNRIGSTEPHVRAQPGAARRDPPAGCGGQEGLPKSFGGKPAILNRGRTVAAHAGCWPRLPAGDRGHFRLRLQGRPARAADPHGK